MITTMPTLESFSASIRLSFYGVDVQAIVASLAGVGWVNCYHFNAILHRFVAQKHSQLEECPTIRAPAFRLVSRHFIGALSNGPQVFNRNDCIVLKRRQNNQFSDVVVYPSWIASLHS